MPASPHSTSFNTQQCPFGGSNMPESVKTTNSFRPFISYENTLVFRNIPSVIQGHCLVIQKSEVVDISRRVTSWSAALGRESPQADLKRVRVVEQISTNHTEELPSAQPQLFQYS